VGLSGLPGGVMAPSHAGPGVSSSAGVVVVALGLGHQRTGPVSSRECETTATPHHAIVCGVSLLYHLCTLMFVF
jgi:hypothetical protein